MSVVDVITTEADVIACHILFGARQKLVYSLKYEFCYGENLILHYGKQNEKPTYAMMFYIYY